MGVFLSNQAEIDLNRIADYIHESSPQNAAEFLGRVQKAIGLLETFPRANRVRDDLPLENLRMNLADPALLIYTVRDNNDCDVLRIAHKSQDLVKLLQP